MESVLRPEGSLWWERFVKKVGLEPGVVAGEEEQRRRRRRQRTRTRKTTTGTRKSKIRQIKINLKIRNRLNSLTAHKRVLSVLSMLSHWQSEEVRSVHKQNVCGKLTPNSGNGRRCKLQSASVPELEHLLQNSAYAVYTQNRHLVRRKLTAVLPSEQ